MPRGGANKKLSESDFIELFQTIGPTRLAERFGMSQTNVQHRRRDIERRIGRQILGPNYAQNRHMQRVPVTSDNAARIHLDIPDGVVLVGSDAHYWPGIVTTAHRAFVRFCKELQPAAVILNGDVLDGASISRHAPINWEERPSLIQELETCQERTHEIVMAAGKARRLWTLGNHDGRFETRLASVAPEFARVHGVHLKDHFPEWEPCWAAWVNGDCVIKHRYKGGIHAAHNNTVQSGKSIVTGHLHSLKVTPFSDYGGTRYGVDTGTLADVGGPQFEYMEDNPRSWRSGFAVLTFNKGRLLWPELAHVCAPGQVEFRGKVIEV